MMRVLKFGGPSLADAVAIERLAVLVSSREGPRTVVVSALAGVTDALVNVADAAAVDTARAHDAVNELTRRHLDLAGMVGDQRRRDLLRACIDGIATSAHGAVVAIAASRRAAPPPLFDRLVALGEVWSSRIVAAVLEDRGVSARWLDGRDVVRTDGRHQCARPDMRATAAAVDRFVRPVLAFGRVAVLGGFIGSAPDGATTTLGRGGSEDTAVLLGACLSAAEIEIWTDVDGILTADPRIAATA
jgi:aspartate kinase